jgi:hypothetical protein
MKTKILALALVAAAPFAASADVSYSYIDVAYQTGSADPGGQDYDGFLLKASGAFSDNWFVEFNYGDYSFDPAGDLSDMALMLGWKNDMFFAKLGYEDAESGGFSDSGYVFDVGARGMVADSFELNGHVGMSDLGTFESFTNYGFGAVWYFGDNMGLSFNYDIRSGDNADLDQMGVGFRFNFN